MVGLAVLQRLKPSSKGSTSNSADADSKTTCQPAKADTEAAGCEWQKETVKVRKREQNFQAILSSLYIKNHAVLDGMPEGYVPPPPAPQVVPNQYWTHTPTEHDVLCGRGSKVNHHPGNVSFREMVAEWKDLYLDENRRKTEKAHVCAFLVDKVRATTGGRFLKRDDRKRIWVEIGDIKARKKAGQALREDATEIRAEKAALKLGGGNLLDKHKKESNSSLATSGAKLPPTRKKLSSASTPDGLAKLIRQKDMEGPKPPTTFFCFEKLKEEESYPDSVIMKASVGSFPVSSAYAGQSQKTGLFSGTGIFDREMDGLASLFSTTSLTQHDPKSLQNERQLSKKVTPDINAFDDSSNKEKPTVLSAVSGQANEKTVPALDHCIKEPDNTQPEKLSPQELIHIPQFCDFNLQYFDHSAAPDAKRQHIDEVRHHTSDDEERPSEQPQVVQRQTSQEDQQLLDLRGRRPSTSSRGNESTSTCTNVAESILVESVVSFDASSFHDIDFEHWVDDCYSTQRMKGGELVFLQQPDKGGSKKSNVPHDDNMFHQYNEAYSERCRLLDRLVLDHEISFDVKSPSTEKAMSILSASVGGSSGAHNIKERDGSH